MIVETAVASYRYRHLLRRASAAAAIVLVASTAGCDAPDTAGTTAAPAEATPLAINFVAIDERLHTAGQPAEAVLAGLGTRGYDLVINLAPPAMTPANEAELLAAAGVRYVNIPVDWRNPTAENFATFTRTLAAASDERVLVHCQMNMRASMFTFLHRVTHDGVEPKVAFEALRAVWVPDGQWAELGRRILEEHGIEFAFPPAP